MDSNSGQTISIWMATTEEPESAPLSENMHTTKEVQYVDRKYDGYAHLPCPEYV